MWVMIRYKVKRDQVERNLELLRAVFEEFESIQPDGPAVRDLPARGQNQLRGIGGD
jgi:hypothetical protein